MNHVILYFLYTKRKRLHANMFSLSNRKRRVFCFLSVMPGSAVTVFQAGNQPPVSAIAVHGLSYSLWMVLAISLFSRISIFRLSLHSLLSFCCLAFSSWSWMIRSCSRPREWLEKTKVPERSAGTSPKTTYSIYRYKTKQWEIRTKADKGQTEGRQGCRNPFFFDPLLKIPHAGASLFLTPSGSDQPGKQKVAIRE